MSEMTLPMAERWAWSWFANHPDAPLGDRAAMTVLMAEYDHRRVENERLRARLDRVTRERDAAVELAGTASGRLVEVEQEVGELAAEWERFGLQGAAQRLRHILGEEVA